MDEDEQDELSAEWQHERRENRLAKYATWIAERARIRAERLERHEVWIND